METNKSEIELYPMTPSQIRQRKNAGALGGQAILERYGVEWLQKIGKLGGRPRLANIELLRQQKALKAANKESEGHRFETCTAYFKAKYTGGCPKSAVKDTLIAPQAHDRTIRKLDTLIVSTGLRRHLEAFLLACRVEDLSRRTIFDYRQKIGQIIDYMVALGLTDPKEVTASHIRGFLLTKQETCQPVSVHGYYRSIKVFFNWLITRRCYQF